MKKNEICGFNKYDELLKLNKKSNYQEKKEEIRQEAINWQLESANKSYFMNEYADITDKFYILAKRYGLIREFKENGVL